MSGIYIPGMEMPKEKGAHEIKITLFVREDGTAGLWGTETHILHEPLTLIPVPEHGRLIDESWLKDAMITTLEALIKNPKMNGQEMHLIAAFDTLRVMLDDAPTIIPATKEGEG